MHITLDFHEWIDDNQPVATCHDELIRDLASVPWSEVMDGWAGEPPFTLQHFRSDRFIFGPASILWLQSREAAAEFERLVTSTTDDPEPAEPIEPIEGSEAPEVARDRARKLLDMQARHDWEYAKRTILAEGELSNHFIIHTKDGPVPAWFNGRPTTKSSWR